MLSNILFDPRLTPAAAALMGAMIGVCGTLLVTIVNGLIGRNRHRREKIWERRQEACSTIVGTLRAAKPWADRIAEGFDDDPHGYYAGKALETENARYWDMIGKADETFKTDYLLLPPRFRARYERLMTSRRGWDFEVGPEAFLGPIEANEQASRDLMDIALSTLGIVPWWSRVWIALRMTRDHVVRGAKKTATKLKRRYKRMRRKAGEDEFDLLD